MIPLHPGRKPTPKAPIILSAEDNRDEDDQHHDAHPGQSGPVQSVEHDGPAPLLQDVDKGECGGEGGDEKHGIDSRQGWVS